MCISCQQDIIRSLNFNLFCESGLLNLINPFIFNVNTNELEFMSALLIVHFFIFFNVSYVFYAPLFLRSFVLLC